MDWRKVGRPTPWRVPRQARPGPNGSKAPSVGKPGSFDQWLDHRLQEMYGSVVEEPLPDELKELVDKLTRGAGDDNADRNK